MNRELLLGIDQPEARRIVTLPFELRAADTDDGLLTFDGYASVTEYEYPVFGGEWPGWMETMAAGAFKRTLKNGADVAFLINHEGMTLARTKSGTLKLNEDERGLHVLAQLDPRQQPVVDLQVAVERGDVDEMSFAFRVEADAWFDDAGEASNEWDGTRRRITEVNMNKGDVSAVNYGANPATSGGFRGIDAVLAEVRAGRLTDQSKIVLREFAASLDAPPVEVVPEQVDTFDPLMAERMLQLWERRKTA